jgi:hypothetical protein
LQSGGEGPEEEDALILGRRQLGAGGDEHEVDAEQHDDREDQHDRWIGQRPVQRPLVAVGQPVEEALDQALESAGAARRFEHQAAQHR